MGVEYVTLATVNVSGKCGYFKKIIEMLKMKNDAISKSMADLAHA